MWNRSYLSSSSDSSQERVPNGLKYLEDPIPHPMISGTKRIPDQVHCNRRKTHTVRCGTASKMRNRMKELNKRPTHQFNLSNHDVNEILKGLVSPGEEVSPVYEPSGLRNRSESIPNRIEANPVSINPYNFTNQQDSPVTFDLSPVRQHNACNEFVENPDRMFYKRDDIESCTQKQTPTDFSPIFKYTNRESINNPQEWNAKDNRFSNRQELDEADCRLSDLAKTIKQENVNRKDSDVSETMKDLNSFVGNIDDGCSGNTSSSKMINDPIMNNKIICVEKLIHTPAPQELMRCAIYSKNGIFPKYHLYFEGSKLLSAKKASNIIRSKYKIVLGSTDLSNKTSSVVGRLKNHIGSSSYTLYDDGLEPSDKRAQSSALRSELAFIPLESSSKMHALVPFTPLKPQIVLYKQKKSSIQSYWKHKILEEFYVLQGRKRKWNLSIIHIGNRTFELEFDNRTAKDSIKNFQMEINDGSLIIQSGRTDKNTFFLDFSWPLTPLQAFAIAIAKFDANF